MVTNEANSEQLKQALTSFCMSRAILEDYAKTIARIEGRQEEEVVQRVRNRTRELMRELQAQSANSTNQVFSKHTEPSKAAEAPIATVSSHKQSSLFTMEAPAGDIQKLDMPDGDVIVYPAFFSKSQSDEYFTRLLANINWQQDRIKFYGKEMPIPRLTAWYGETDKPYTYSGIPMSPHPWTPDLLSIKQAIEQVAGVNFSSVLLNLYRDGRDSVSWHSDDEKELGQNPTIASISFGDTRVFQFKHKFDKAIPKVDVPLTHGSLVIMQGTTQHNWQHQIPKTAKELKERINLTFRVIK
jgi:alkylated DNA repair dioxygenase AlkB